ncbi:MAG: HNH endonuclease signature motif containing protein [Elusimicrobiota bacterium]
MDCSTMNDVRLTEKLEKSVSRETRDTAEVVALLAEFDNRELYADRGYPSLFAYCTEKLGYSEGGAYRRIRAARSSRRFPEIFELLVRGELHLEAVALLTPFLNAQNAESLLAAARGKSKRDLQCLLAELFPRADVADCVRKVPIEPAQKIEPLSTERVLCRFTGSEQLRRDIERARELLRHKYPEGRLEDIFSEALECLLDKKDPERKVHARRNGGTRPRDPRPSGTKPEGSILCRRYIPRWVRDTVWRRDKGKCRFESAEGKVCGERGGLEFDHIVPWAMGGPSNDPRNIRLLCRAHNKLQSRRYFGSRTARHSGP